MGDEMFKHEFSQLAVYEDRRTPVLLNEEQYNRARACVNACAGMKDPEANLSEMRHKITSLHIRSISSEKQRDDLLAALEKLQRRLSACTENDEGANESSIRSWLDIVNIAISSAKGGAA